MPPLIQITAAISPGSSGGGLFDREGNLVGLTTLYVEGGQNLNFALPVEWIGDVKPGRKPVTKGIGQIGWEKRIFALENVKDWHGIIDWGQRWAKSDPNNARAWFWIGAAYFKLSSYNDAIEAFRQALRIDSQYAIAWNSLGLSYGELGRYNDAIEAYRQALRIDPQMATAWYSLGLAYKELDLYNDAIEAFKQALRFDPKNADIWTNLSVAYALSGNRTAALAAVQELRPLDPETAEKIFNLIVPR